MTALAGIPMVESWMAPRDSVLIGNDPGLGLPRRTMILHPSMAMRLRNHGRTPFFTAYSIGERELQRDRRRRAR